ncbi:MAG: transcriptional repressor [Oscillospiraceae bacterium]|nr:transcriptional repressor [Oscillospiraceae bacterium]
MALQNKHFQKRDAILKCLCSTDTHPSADWIYEQLRQQDANISLATVYRNLALFKKQGLIQSIATVNGVERFDGNTAPHVHFICTGCDAVQDLSNIQVPQELCSTAGKTAGARIEGCQLSFTGLCGNCQKS